MDKLKNFIDTNREAFEDDLLPEGHFERFEKKLPPARRKHFKLYSLSAFAAAAAIALILLLRMPGGTPTPINQVANISVPEPRSIVIQPWEKNMLSPIEKAIMKSDLGLTPNSDGSVIRLNIPQLTQQRRTELVKVVHKKAEESRVAIRNLRRDANESIKKIEKD